MAWSSVRSHTATSALPRAGQRKRILEARKDLADLETGHKEVGGKGTETQARITIR